MARAKTKKSATRPAQRTTKKRAPKPAAKARRAAHPKRGAAKAAGTYPAMRALARRIIAVTLGGDDQAMLALYAPGIESSEAGQPPEAGIDALRAKFAGWRNMTTVRASSRAASASTATSS